MSAKNVAVVAETRKYLDRAMLRTQQALAEAEAGACDPKYIARIARALRDALVNLECIPRAIDQIEGVAKATSLAALANYTALDAQAEAKETEH